VFPSSRPIPELALALSMLLGPGGCGASPEGEASEDPLLHVPPAGDPQPPVYVGRGLTSSTTPEAGTAFESRMASVHIQDAARVDWHSLAGHVVVTEREEGELEVALLDLVFERGRTIDEPRITRVMRGTISGVVWRECYGPSRESADPSWSPDDCAEVRRAGGF
jgi:hypothetical protein